MGYGIKRGERIGSGELAGQYAAHCDVCGKLYGEAYFIDCWGNCRCPTCRAALRVDPRDLPSKSGPKAESAQNWEADD